MKLLAVLFTALVLAVPTAGAAPSQSDPDLAGVDPFATFVVTRILPNGNERVLGTAAIESVEQEQLIRSVALAAGRQNRTNNPSWRIVIYGPIDLPSTWYTDDDRIWDSATDL